MNDQILLKLNQFRRENNWLAIVNLLAPLCREGTEGWHDPDLLSEYGFALSQVNRLVQAEQVYQRWADLQPRSARARYCLGYVFYLRQDWENAIERFQTALELWPEYFVCLYRLAYAYYQWNKPQRSIEPLQRALSLYESHTDEDWQRRNAKNYVKSMFLLGKAFLITSQPEEALICFQNVLRLDERNYIKPEFKLYEIGKTLGELQQYAKAIATLKRALNPRFPQPYILDRLGRVYHKAGKYSEALQTYNQAVNIRQLPFILFNRAETLLALGQTAEAIADLHAALKRDNKGKHKILLRLAQISQDQNRLEEAAHYCRQAMRWKWEVYQAHYAEAHYLLSQILLQQGNKEEAEKELQTALALKPELEWDASLSEHFNIEEPLEGAESPVF
ncbi:MAG: hypothetical protein Kow0042_31020 [Calditrichia bacterium]